MEVTLRSTTKIVELEVGGGQVVPARVWEGRTAAGIECHAYITRIAVAKDLDSAEFERDLRAHKPPTAAVAAIPLRMIL